MPEVCGRIVARLVARRAAAASGREKLCMLGLVCGRVEYFSMCHVVSSPSSVFEWYVV